MNWLVKVVGLNGTPYLINRIRFSNDLLRCLDRPPNKSPELSGLDTPLHTLDSGVLIAVAPWAS